ncbi:hypothetical protein HETIRDRAFT_452615 [Heterobasidion irregulare TC 32-1]|uniref:Uncharacterized protein n=1 Tax=Heterobasidion irregulare (strain TC 32-1) TaxID=747525 RepID=W4K2X1_HETIT|nr:uncharacterized protein HETIRDRAFT_452615 [Heterobasidion irregulare TC 32-1]ETW79406.1 hypothetical protein HETIRDRAFT_452615 [Heterobasidion irregulare TC 32-1]
MNDSDAVNCSSIKFNVRGPLIEQEKHTAHDEAGARPHSAKRNAASLHTERPSTVASQSLRSAAWHRVQAMAVNLPSDYALAITTHSAMSQAAEEKRAGSGQIHNTRANLKIKNHKLAVDAAASRYRLARSKLVSLGLSPEDPTYRELQVSDVVPFTVYTVDQQLGDSKRQPSWIWSDFHFVEGQNEEIRQYCEEMLKVHWFRRSALKTRWQEQLMLVEEEMCRILRFFDYHEELWRSRVTSGGGTAGLSAYARK